ncbi:MAG TPA: PAS domain S-box protein [Nitrospirota bacterium]|nr:PAS domain S-box protein [Nitrospirota bacterium]
MLKADLLKNEVVIRVWNQPDPEAGFPEILERLGLNAKTSLMNMLLNFKGNQVSSLALFADGVNQYTAEHARLLKLLHGPFVIAMSNALRHQEIIRFKDESVSHLQFFQNMDRINRAMQGTNDLEQTMSDVLDAMLSIFDCDRAFLVYPCDPDATSFEAVMERTRLEYPARRSAISTAPDNAKHFQLYLASSGAVTLGPGCDYPLEISRFGEKSKIMIALYPKTGKPWVLGMHQCSYPRVWTPDEKNLLNEIARRMSDVLTSLLAHRNLHESEKRHRIILQTAMDGLFRADPQGQILEVNETYCRMSGYSEQELLTMHIADIEAVQSAEMIAASIRRAAELGPNRFESVHRRKDGSVFDVEISSQYQAIAGGQTVVFVRDITERKRVEEALRQSEAYLAEAERLSHAGSWVFDLASDKYVYISEECFRIFGLDLQEDLPNREAISRLIHPEDWDRVKGDFEKLLREKVDTSSEFRLVLPGGTVKHVQTIRHPVLNDAGDVVKLVGTAIDITERKRAEEEIKKTEERFRILIETMNEGFGVRNEKGVWTYVNDQLCLMLGHLPGDIIGHPVTEFLDEANQSVLAEEIQRERKGNYSHYEITWTREDGIKVTTIVSPKPIFNPGSQVKEVFAVLTDITERKQAEDRLRHTTKALRRSEAYLAEAQRLSHTGSWAFDFASNKYVYASEECLRIFELDAQQGLPTREVVSRRVHPEDWDKVGGDFEKSLREKVDASSEFRLVLPSGTVKHIHVVRHPVLNEAGDVVELVGTTIDITERKRAEEALRLAGVYNRSLIEASLDPLVTIDPEGRITDVNATTEQVTGYARTELIGSDFSDYFTEPKKARRGYHEAFSEGLVRDYELNIRHRDGKITPVIYNASVYRDEAGNAIGVFAAARDITERKRAEAEINSLKNHLSNIINSMPSILVGMDNARTVTQWNHQAEAFTGIPAGEAVGKPIVHLLPDFAPWIMIMGADMDEHRPSSMEKLLIEKEGERRFYDLMLYPLLIDTVGGAVLRIEDVTERARIQELMVQAEKMMSIGGLAAGMAHEINNPLGIITQAAQNIERRISLELHANRKVSEELGLNLEGIRAYFDKRQISDAIASIRTASSRAAKIVANMLQFSRRADTTMEFASLAQIVDRTLELAASDYDLKKNYDFRSIEIIKDYQDTPQVRMVSVEVEQVILNLLKNAAQAMIVNRPDRKPRITLRLYRKDRYAVLEVEDNGPGMTEDILGRVFEPFFTTKEPGAGTGLGLSVSYMIVTQNHKGFMEVQSTPGKGTLFRVKLPIGGSET